MGQGPRYFGGLDLGQAQDFTALAVLEQTRGTDPLAPGREVYSYAVRHLRRWPLGTPYTQITRDLGAMFAGPPLAGSVLAVDQTGVGKAVVDMLRHAGLKARLRPVTITPGRGSAPDGAGGWDVGKRELVGTLQVLLQARRLQVARSLPEAGTLVRELETFRVKVPAGPTETFEAWREGDHDDLVLAVGVAAWVGDRRHDFKLEVV